MRVFEESKKTVISLLRAKGNIRDRDWARMRLNTMFSTTDLGLGRLPPSAIVFIHHLRDPLPGALNLDREGILLPPAWEKSVQSTLNKLVSQAYRPALGFVPSSAESVIFLDKSEMLSCLASDWCDEKLLNRWWWKSLLKTDLASSVLRVWLDSVQHAPDALERLARHGIAERFVLRLDNAGAKKVLDAILHNFALRELNEALTLALDASAEDVKKDDAGIGIESKQNLQAGFYKSTSRDVAPWDRWVKEYKSDMSPSQLYLLVTGLMLVRATAVARSNEFAEQLRLWHRSANEIITDEQPQIIASDSPAHDRYGDTTTSQTAARSFTSANDAEEFIKSDAADSMTSLENIPVNDAQNFIDHSQLEITDHNDLNKVADGALEGGSEISNATGAGDQSNTPKHELQNPDQLINDRNQSLKHADNDHEGAEITPLIEADIETSLGGIFYLINLGLFLNLYGDFTSPMRPGIALSIWDFLALVGGSLLGKRFEMDNTSSLLARLAGRSANEEPGRNFSPPDEWRIPADWLAPFSEKGLWIADISNGRLRVKHPKDFFVIDIAIPDVTSQSEADESDQLKETIEREISVYKQAAEFEVQYDFLHNISNEEFPIGRWIGWLVPYMRARLIRALGISEEAALAEFLFKHRARVVISSARLDIFYSLGELPVEIRLSGLDRDPGWIPAAGRSIAFHFE